MQVLDKEVNQAQTYLDRERQQVSRELAQDLSVTDKGELKV